MMDWEVTPPKDKMKQCHTRAFVGVSDGDHQYGPKEHRQ